MSAPMDTSTKEERKMQNEIARQVSVQKKAEKQRLHLENQKKVQEAKALKLKAKAEKTKQHEKDVAMKPAAPSPVVSAAEEAERARKKEEKLQKKEANKLLNEQAQEAKQKKKEEKKVKTQQHLAEIGTRRKEMELREVMVKIDPEEVKNAIIDGLKASNVVESFSQAGQNGQWKLRLKTGKSAAQLKKVASFVISSTVSVEAAPVTAHSVYFRCPDTTPRDTRQDRDAVLEHTHSMLNGTKIRLGTPLVAWKGNVICVTFDNENQVNKLMEKNQGKMSLQNTPIDVMKGRPSDSFVRGSRKRQRQESEATN